jgi:hypothetical protein
VTSSLGLTHMMPGMRRLKIWRAGSRLGSNSRLAVKRLMAGDMSQLRHGIHKLLKRFLTLAERVGRMIISLRF